MPAGAVDKYSNLLYDSVTESGANTLTFEAIDIGLNIFDKVGLLIHRIEWYRWHDLLAAAADLLTFGLSASNGWATATPAETSILTYHRASLVDYGTAGNNYLTVDPMIDDFTTLPGGGLLTTPKPLYMFGAGSNLASAATIKMRMFFTIVTLKPEEYFELLESRAFFG